MSGRWVIHLSGVGSLTYTKADTEDEAWGILRANYLAPRPSIPELKRRGCTAEQDEPIEAPDSGETT